MTAAKKPRSSRAERAYREEIDAAHQALDGDSDIAGRGCDLASRCCSAVTRVEVVERELRIVRAELAAVTGERDTAAHTAHRWEDVARKLAQHVGATLALDSNSHPVGFSVEPRAPMPVRDVDSGTVIATLATLLSIEIDGSKPAELIALAREAATAARGS